jgi:hypothetical protein
VIDRVVIPSAHVNAMGLVLSLRAVGFPGPILCLKRRQRPALTERFPDLCETELLGVTTAADLPDTLAARFPDLRSTILHTDERFLAAFADDHRFHGVRGAGARLAEVVHRARFYEVLRRDALALTPDTIASHHDPRTVLGRVYRTRVWHTWRDLQRLPRGERIDSPEALERWRAEAAEAGLTDDEWGFQAQLSDAPEDNVSVCGWHGPHCQQYLVTRRRGVASGLGWWVQRILDPATLRQTTARVLEAFEYEGPFELEFVRDPDHGAFVVIELNPRFWMQHRLAQALTDHALVRRAMGMPAAETVGEGAQHWLQTDVALRHPLRTAGLTWRAVWAHPPLEALRFLARRRA